MICARAVRHRSQAHNLEKTGAIPDWRVHAVVGKKKSDWLPANRQWEHYPPAALLLLADKETVVSLDIKSNAIIA